jgi:hypothetical protein
MVQEASRRDSLAPISFELVGILDGFLRFWDTVLPRLLCFFVCAREPKGHFRRPLFFFFGSRGERTKKGFFHYAPRKRGKFDVVTCKVGSTLI